MKDNKIIYIIILIVSAVIAYSGAFNNYINKNGGRPAVSTPSDNNPQTDETQLLQTPHAPDYSFTLRAAGISSQMPVYSIYNIALYGDTPEISKINECILGFKVSRIIHLKSKKYTLLLNAARDTLYSFNESDYKIENRIISFTAAPDNQNSAGAAAATQTNGFDNGVNINYTALPAATPKDIISAIAKSKDEKLIAAALTKSATIQIILAGNFERILSITDKSAGLNNIKSLDFDAKNNLYITTVDNSANSTTLYLCRANLSYSKLEKINWFSLAADSSLFDLINDICLYYNRASGTLFKIDSRNAQSGIIMNNPPQLSEAQAGDICKPDPAQLIKLYDSCALVRNDNKTIKIFNAVTGESTHEIKLNSAAGTEITGGADEKYSVITSASEGTISLLDRSNLNLIIVGRLEGINLITSIESN
jgi:hypothetical protein